MKATLRKERLPMPPVPDQLYDSVENIRDWVWGTRPEKYRLYDLESYTREAISSPGPDYVLVGHDGHGTNSWFFHGFVSLKNVAIFVQAPWGGAYTNSKMALEGLKVRFELMEKLLYAVESAERAGRVLPGRLIVQQSSITSPRWAWVKEDGILEWKEEFANAMTPALESVQGFL